MFGRLILISVGPAAMMMTLSAAKPAPALFSIACPTGLSLSETVQAAKLPNGLIPFAAPGPSPPTGMALFVGNPVLGHRISPSNSNHPYFNNTGLDIWRFQNPRSDLWFACIYGQNGLLLSRPVHVSVTFCRTVAAKGDNDSISCF